MDNIPHSPEAEAAVLGSLLIDNDQWDGLALTQSDFFIPKNSVMFGAMQAVHAKGIPTDQVTVAQELIAMGKDREVGMGYLAAVCADTPTSLNCPYYAKVLKEHATRRKLIEWTGKAAQMAYTHTDAEAVLQSIDHDLVELRRSHGRMEVMSPRERIDRLEVRYNMLNNRADDVLIPTGISKLDVLLGGGLGEGEMTVIGASTSVGKTEFARYIANYVGQKHPVLFCTAEMTWHGLSDRDVAGITGLSLATIRAGKYTTEDYDKIVAAMGQLSERNVHIYPDKPVSAVTVSGIAAASEQMSARGGVRLIVVDYLQYLGSDSSNTKQNRYQEIGEMVEGLGRLAKKLNCHIILVSQLNRQAGKGDTRPSKSELYECVTGDTRVVSEDGQLVEIKSLKAGASILAVDDQQKVRPYLVERAWSTGVKEVYKVTTRTGKVITVTSNHPFLTCGGYRRLDELNVGDIIGTARNTPVRANVVIDTEECRLLGYLVGDGSTQETQSIGFINNDSEIANDVISICTRRFGVEAHCSLRQDTYDIKFVRVNGSKGRGSRLREWLRGIGLSGKIYNTKRVPGYVFGSGCSGAAHFLAGYLATDGSVQHSLRSGSVRWSIRFDTTSRGLADDILLLLARLGIVGVVNKGYKSKKATIPIYRVTVTSAGVLAFAELVGPHVRGPKGLLLAVLVEEQWTCSETQSVPNHLPPEIGFLASAVSKGIVPEETRSQWRRGKRLISRASANKLGVSIDNATLVKWAHSDILWEPIRSIEPAGVAEVWDISVPGANNFIGNLVVSHNSGKVEQHADLILLLYRIDAFYDEESYVAEYDAHAEWHKTYPKPQWDSTYQRVEFYPKNIVELQIAKQRQGGHLALLLMKYDPVHGTFCSYQGKEKKKE